jgi:hypothetical protein
VAYATFSFSKSWGERQKNNAEFETPKFVEPAGWGIGICEQLIIVAPKFQFLNWRVQGDL